MGVEAEEIDTVFCNHLHVDHVGWNTQKADGRWVPTFPHARHLFGRLELADWMARRAAGTARAGGGIFLRPIFGTQRGRSPSTIGRHS